MTTSDPPNTAPSEPIPLPSALEVQASEGTELDRMVAAAKASLTKKPIAAMAGCSFSSDDTLPESPAPPAAEIEPVAEEAAVFTPALNNTSSSGRDDVAEPFVSSTASGDEVRYAQEKFSASDDGPAPPDAVSVAGELTGLGGLQRRRESQFSLFVCFLCCFFCFRGHLVYIFSVDTIYRLQRIFLPGGRGKTQT